MRITETLSGMSREGCRPATIHEILSFGINQRILQKPFSVTALGSMCSIEKTKHVPTLFESNSQGKGVFLEWAYGSWNEDDYFLGVEY